MKRLLFALALMLCASSADASTCYVSEFVNSGDAGIQVAKQPGLDQAPITVSGSSAQSAAFKPSTRLIRVNCDVVVSYLVGANPVATTSNARLPTGTVEYFQVIPGMIIAFITNT